MAATSTVSLMLSITSPWLLAASADAPQQRALPPGTIATIEAGDLERAEKSLRAEADRCRNSDPRNATCIQLLNTLARVGEMGDKWQLQLAAAREAAEAAKRFAPGSDLEYVALANLSAALERSDTPLAAEAPARKALAIAERLWSPSSDQVATIARNLAILLSDQGRHGEAEELTRRVYHIQISLTGKNSLAALDAARVLAVRLSEAGKFAEALQLHAYVTSALAKGYSTRTEARALAEGDYALALSNTGQYTDAAKRFSAAIALWRTIKEPPIGLETALNNAATNFSAMGQYAEAEALHREVLAARSARFGPDNPSMAVSYGNLATVIDAQGRSDEALPLFRRALDIAVKAYGADHVRTLAYRANLIDRLPIGEQVSEREQILAIRRKSLGPDHPDTLLALQAYAGVLVNAGRDGDAEMGYREVISRGAKVYGPDNVNLADAMVSLALCLARQLKPGTLAEMKSLISGAWVIQARVLGDTNADTIVSAVYLAQLSDDAAGRTLARRAQHGVIGRMAQQRSFDAAALLQFRNFHPIFRQGVKVNWKLAHPQRAAP